MQEIIQDPHIYCKKKKNRLAVKAFLLVTISHDRTLTKTIYENVSFGVKTVVPQLLVCVYAYIITKAEKIHRIKLLNIVSNYRVTQCIQNRFREDSLRIKHASRIFSCNQSLVMIKSFLNYEY